MIEGWKPCPFCGKDDLLSVTDRKFFEDLQEGHERACLRVQCVRCNVEVYEFTFDEHDYDKRVDLLKAKWNMRVNV